MTADVNNHKISENVLTPDGQIITSQRFDAVGAGAGWYFYNYDIRQSTTAVIDHAGNKVTGYQYDSFGNTKSDNDDDDFINETKFTGAISDSNTGLYYMNARYYNPNTGRFLSRDTYKGQAYAPWTQHLYTYTGNNPVNFIDPTGHWAVRSQMAWIDGDEGYTRKLISMSKRQREKGKGSSNMSTVTRTSEVKTSDKSLASLPPKGKPDSVGVLRNPDGSVKQRRVYGPNSVPEFDVDMNHGGQHEFPHKHPWPRDPGVHDPVNPEDWE